MILDPNNMSGVSPPYSDERFIESGMNQGSHMHYAAFPETPLSEIDPILNAVIDVGNSSLTSGHLNVKVREGFNLPQSDFSEYPVHVFYILDKQACPVSCVFGDIDFRNMQLLCNKYDIPLILSEEELGDKLLNSVMVWTGNSLIHSRETAPRDFQ